MEPVGYWNKSPKRFVKKTNLLLDLNRTQILWLPKIGVDASEILHKNADIIKTLPFVEAFHISKYIYINRFAEVRKKKTKTKNYIGLWALPESPGQPPPRPSELGILMNLVVLFPLTCWKKVRILYHLLQNPSKKLQCSWPSELPPSKLPPPDISAY